MKFLVLCFILNSTFFVNFVYSNVSVVPYYENAVDRTIVFSVSSWFQLSCNISSDAAKPVSVEWKKDSKPIADIPALKDRFRIANTGINYTLRIDHATEDDMGNYTCTGFEEQNAGDEKMILAVSKPAVRISPNLNVVEGEKLRLHCNVFGKPYAAISWTYKNDSLSEKEVVKSDRTTFEEDKEKEVENAILIVNDVQLYDRGVYTCIGTPPLNQHPVRAECTVRVKDKYAALWPFLGICAEVFVLCAIIFIYEKKRNKTELEESDTDQSPDQKTTPDHNKESNLRHRQ